ncbi:hypothetical protein J11TS1_39070 [Oceanobacillus sp. J11TS1]|nr:hypothetical protein J11TS1_39070 [Oceanobacillus sp. J11TS1]
MLSKQEILDEQKDSSDIDVIVEFNDVDVSFDKYMDLKTLRIFFRSQLI